MMSFTATVKKELIANIPRKPCCRRAMLLGLFYMRAHLREGEVQISLRDREIQDLVILLTEEQFSRQCERKKQEGSGVSELLCFTSPSASKYVSGFDTAPAEQVAPPKCPECKKHFLAGIFLAAGRISTPKSGYLLEFSCGDRQDSLAAFLQTVFLIPKYSCRRHEKLLYFRDSVSIEDFFARIGATQAVFTLMDHKIERDMRNNANRAANCDANNIDKTVSAAMRQIELIERLIAENKLSYLSPDLEATALLRLQNPDVSLQQLAAMSEPAMTKSGLNHRLQKIMETAEELLKK